MKFVNEGIADRILRACAGLMLSLAAFPAGILEGSIAGIIIAAISGVLILTATVGFCPAYMLVGLNTCPMDKAGTKDA